MAEMSRRTKITLEQQAAQCMLCYDAPCTAACGLGADPAAMVRSIRFENLSGAAAAMKNVACVSCAHSCESACLQKLPLAEMAAALPAAAAQKPADLSISFCGVPCVNPFFLSSSVVASNYEMCARALEQGWGGIVFKTIGFYRPKEVSPRFDTVSAAAETGLSRSYHRCVHHGRNGGRVDAAGSAGDRCRMRYHRMQFLLSADDRRGHGQ